MSKPYGGKDHAGWISVIDSGKGELGYAADNLRDMVISGHMTAQKEVFPAAKAVAKLTHSKNQSHRAYAFGAVGAMVRHFGYYMFKGTERESFHAAQAIRLIIIDCHPCNFSNSECFLQSA